MTWCFTLRSDITFYWVCSAPLVALTLYPHLLVDVFVLEDALQHLSPLSTGRLLVELARLDHLLVHVQLVPDDGTDSQVRSGQVRSGQVTGQVTYRVTRKDERPDRSRHS